MEISGSQLYDLALEMDPTIVERRAASIEWAETIESAIENAVADKRIEAVKRSDDGERVQLYLTTSLSDHDVTVRWLRDARARAFLLDRFARRGIALYNMEGGHFMLEVDEPPLADDP